MDKIHEAAKSHEAVKTLIDDLRLSQEILSNLRDSDVAKAIYYQLEASDGPVLGRDIRKRTALKHVKSTISKAVDRLNESMQHASDESDRLKAEKLAVQVHKSKGGTPIGYYFVCCWKKRDESSYLTADAVRKQIKKIAQSGQAKHTVVDARVLDNASDPEIPASPSPYDDNGHSWWDLYCRALVASTLTQPFIELSARFCRSLSRRDTEETSNSESMLPAEMIAQDDVHSIFEMLRDNAKVLLLGPSGGGKTTTLRHLACQLAGKTESDEDSCFLPLFVPMKWFGLWAMKSERPPQLSAYLAFHIRETIDVLSTSELLKCNLFSGRQKNDTSRPSRRNMLETITQIAERFLADPESSFSGVTLLLDGVNEIPQIALSMVNDQLTRLIDKMERVVVTTRPCRGAMVFSGACQIELCKLSDEKIREYAALALGPEHHGFPNVLWNNPEVLSMARNPFFLSLIIEKVNNDPRAKIPDNRALLIKDFIFRAMQRKQDENTVLADDVKDSLLFTVLPGVAIWSLDCLTQTVEVSTTPFHQSSHFRQLNVSANDTYEALRIAENYGLLTTAGLPVAFHQSGESPTFIHDNVRDYFAALALRNVDETEFMSSLNKRLEHYVWDEPLLMQLELGVKKPVLNDLVEDLIPTDLILASMCVKCADGIDECEILDLERMIRYSKNYEERIDSLPYGFHKGYSRPICTRLSIHILSRLPIKTLLGLTTHPKKEDVPRHLAGLAMGETVSVDDLSKLEEIWEGLSSADEITRFLIFCAVCKIPSFAAFKKAVSVYKEVHNDPASNPLMAKMMEPEILALITYSFSCSKACAVFPIEAYERELSVLISMAATVDVTDLPIIKRLLPGHPPERYAKQFDYLAKTLGKDAIDIFQECLSISLSSNPIGLSGRSYEFFYERIISIEPHHAFELLIDSAKEEDRYFAREVFWQLLIKTRDVRLVPHAIRLISQSPDTEACFLCADFLRSWPDREGIRDCFIKFREEREHLTESHILLGALIGLNEHTSDARAIFVRIWSAIVLGRRISHPQDEAIRTLIDLDPSQWQKDQRTKYYKLFPLAYLAVGDVWLNKGSKHLWRLMDWAYSSLQDPEIVNGINYGILTMCLVRIRSYIGTDARQLAVEEVLDSQILMNLLQLLIWAPQGFVGTFWHHRLEIAMKDLLASLPADCTEAVIPHIRDLYIESHVEEVSDKGTPSKAEDILLCLCQRAGHTGVIQLIRFLMQVATQTTNDRQRDDIMGLVMRIQLAKGRRYLDTT